MSQKRISLNELPLELQKLSKNVTKSFDESIKVYTTTLTSRLYDNSPVDTGLYRSNHSVSIGERFTGEFGITDKSTVVGDAKSKINEFNSEKDNLVFIQNNLDYAESLENGHSKRQAPSGIYGHTLSGGDYKFIKKGLD